MAIIAGGKKAVAAAGTPVQLSAPSGIQKGKYITIQALATNTGNIYVGNAGLNKGTLAAVMAILGPTANPLQIFTDGPSLNPEDLWIDGDTNGNAVVWGFAS